MNPWTGYKDLWKAVRDLQEAIRQMDRRLEGLESIRDRKRSQRDWFLTKLVPGVGTAALAFAALDSLFHWTM